MPSVRVAFNTITTVMLSYILHFLHFPVGGAYLCLEDGGNLIENL